MRYKQVPNYGLECLSMRRDCFGIDDRNKYAGFGNSCSVATVPTNNSANTSSNLSSVIQSSDKIWTDIAFEITPTYGKDQDHVAVV